MTDCAHDWAAFLSVVADHDLFVLWPDGDPPPVFRQKINTAACEMGLCVAIVPDYDNPGGWVMTASRVPVSMGDRELH